MRGERTEREAGALFDGRDPCLRGLVLPEDELLIVQKVLLRHRVAGRTQLPGLVMDEGDDLPERTRNLHAVADRVVGHQERAGHDGDAHVIGPRVVERVALEREPDAGVERLHLRHGVRHVHRVAVAERGLVRFAPDRVLAARHVAARELRLVPVALVLDLLA